MPANAITPKVPRRAALAAAASTLPLSQPTKAAGMTDLSETITNVLTTYVDHWNEYDVDPMIAMWDEEEPEPIYIAEEREPLIGWDAIKGYWQGADPETSDHLITFRDVIAREIAPGVAHAFWHMNWNAYFANEMLYQKPIGGPVRVTALLRKKDGNWKFFHWIEAPLASLIQLKRAHEAAVDPKFIAKLKAKGIEM